MQKRAKAKASAEVRMRERVPRKPASADLQLDFESGCRETRRNGHLVYPFVRFEESFRVINLVCFPPNTSLDSFGIESERELSYKR